MRDFDSQIVFANERLKNYLFALKSQGRRYFLFTDETVLSLYEKEISSAGIPYYAMPPGEEHKDFETLIRLLERMAAAELLRNDALLCMGGGVVLDLGGLAASVYMRGISHVNLPSSLLAQADASYGGKTGIDFHGVKNLIGSFHAPEKIVIFPEFLNSLPRRELICGMGEIVKCGALKKNLFEFLWSRRNLLYSSDHMEEAVERCLRMKRKIVLRDPTEKNLRRCLNLGHTTAHALETASKGLNHGESVLYGIFLESGISARYGGDLRFLKRLKELCKIAMGTMPAIPLSEEDFLSVKWDKKNTGAGKVRLVVAKRAGKYAEIELPFAEYRESIEKEMQTLC